jgi:hypothetical protein
MKTFKIRNALAAAAVLLSVISIPATSRADTWAVGHIVGICHDCFPEQGVVFLLDAGVSSCPTGSWVYYGGGASIDKLKAVYAAALASSLSGRTVSVGFSSSCNAVDFRWQ